MDGNESNSRIMIDIKHPPAILPLVHEGAEPSRGNSRRLSFLLGMLCGSVMIYGSALYALHTKDLKWQSDAYQHSAAVWYVDEQSQIRWMWLDEFVLLRLSQEYHPRQTPTPQPVL